MVDGGRFAKVTLVLKKLGWFAKNLTVELREISKTASTMATLHSEATLVDVLAM